MNGEGDPLHDVVWHDARDLGVRGLGWETETREQPFDRLPLELKALLPPELWRLTTQSAGVFVDFRTDAGRIFVRWRMESETGESRHPYAAECGRSGVDAYGLDDAGVWRWIGSQEAWGDPDCLGKVSRTELDGRERTVRVYFPLMRRTLSLQIGIRTPLKPAARSPAKPIAYYGTSIVHGSGVSRAGLAHAAQMGRRLNRDVLNLGVCGRAWCEPPLADALGRLDPACFLIDVLPNNTPEQLRERLPPFLERLRNRRPHTPMVLVGDRVFGDAAFQPERRRAFEEKTAALMEVHRAFASGADTPVRLLVEPDWFGEELEGTTDASHPNDLGAWRMAQRLASRLKRIPGLSG